MRVRIDETITKATYEAVVAYCNENGFTIDDFLLRALAALQGGVEGTQDGADTDT